MQITLLRWLNSLLRLQMVILTVLLFWIYLFLLMQILLLQWLTPLRNFDVPVSVSIDFPSKSQQNTLFHLIAYDYSCAVCNGLFDHLRDVWWEDTLKLSASAAASDLCEWVQVRIDVYIPHHKYHVKLHSSAAFAATIVHRNHFFPLHQQNKSSESKRKFRQSSSKWFLKLLNLHMLIKEKSL